MKTWKAIKRFFWLYFTAEGWGWRKFEREANKAWKNSTPEERKELNKFDDMFKKGIRGKRAPGSPRHKTDE